MNRARMVIVAVMLIVLAFTLAGAFLTRGVMTYLPFLEPRKGNWKGAYVPHGVVDQRPWQTAATLAALTQSAEERELAREAERLADHEVDQAFSQSLRQALDLSPSSTPTVAVYRQYGLYLLGDLSSRLSVFSTLKHRDLLDRSAGRCGHVSGPCLTVRIYTCTMSYRCITITSR